MQAIGFFSVFVLIVEDKTLGIPVPSGLHLIFSELYLLYNAYIIVNILKIIINTKVITIAMV